MNQQQPMYPPLEGQDGMPQPPPGYAPHPQFQGQATGGGVVTQQQPMMMQMGPPPGMGGVPHGLEYLTQLDQLIVKQKIEGLEAVLGFESQNKYIIRNSMGQVRMISLFFGISSYLIYSYSLRRASVRVLTRDTLVSPPWD